MSFRLAGCVIIAFGTSVFLDYDTVCCPESIFTFLPRKIPDKKACPELAADYYPKIGWGFFKKIPRRGSGVKPGFSTPGMTQGRLSSPEGTQENYLSNSVFNKDMSEILQ